MSRVKDMVVCNFDGCNQVYTDPRILPCGNRTCAAHIDAMLLKTMDETGIYHKKIACYFCQKAHSFPEDGTDFPEDKMVHMVLSMRHCDEHEAAKDSFKELSKQLDELIALDKKDFVVDHFKRAEADILLEKEASINKLNDHYGKLLDEVRTRQRTCLRALETQESELNAIEQAFVDHKSQLANDRLDFVLKTLDGDVATWRAIQAQCECAMAKMRALADELKQKILQDQVAEIRPSAPDIQLESMCGSPHALEIDSVILSSDVMKNNLVNLCRLADKEFKLIYRATRDGFLVPDFHARCDHKPRTLTIVKSTENFVFGAYTAVAWDTTSGWQSDPHAFIFSLVNPSSTPMLIPVKGDGQNAIYCGVRFGATFGCGPDLCISHKSNMSTSSHSNLGSSFSFSLFEHKTAKAKSFLAGSFKFKTTEIEVFQLI